MICQVCAITLCGARLTVWAWMDAAAAALSTALSVRKEGAEAKRLGRRPHLGRQSPPRRSNFKHQNENRKCLDGGKFTRRKSASTLVMGVRRSRALLPPS